MTGELDVPGFQRRKSAVDPIRLVEKSFRSILNG